MLTVEAVTKVYEPPSRWLRPLVRTAVTEPLTALDRVSMTVGRGEIVGLIGPNGAGKTTLIKIISTLLEPTSGRAQVDELDTSRQSRAVRGRLGLVLEGDQGLYERLTGRQNLELYGALGGLSATVARRRADELLEILELTARDKLVFGYSAGMKARLSIGRALMTDPPLIVLDEPTRSLDPIASRTALERLQLLANEGRAVLLSNHRMDEVADVCTRVVALVDGRIRFEVVPHDLGEPGASGAALARMLSEHVAARQ